MAELTLDYNNNVPNGPDDPADDQPEMLLNTQSVNTWTDVDHIGYNILGGGLHKKVTMKNIAAPGFPNGGDGVLYANLDGGRSWPWWQNALGSVLLVNRLPLNAATGYASLPGGLIIAWGSISGAPITDNTSVTFPVGLFTNVFSLTLGGSDSAGAGRASNPISYRTLTTAGFVVSTLSSSYLSLSWMAIGN